MSFEVTADELVTHASHLGGLTDRLRTAVSAANTVSMSDGAYGLLCSFLPPIVNPMEQAGVAALTAAAEGVSTTAENVLATAADYVAIDETHAATFRTGILGVRE